MNVSSSRLGALAVLASAAVLWGSPALASPPTAGQTLGNQHANLSTQITSHNVSTTKPAWYVPAKGRVSSTPLVWQGSVIFSDWSGRVWSVNVGTGKVLWQRRLEKPTTSWQWHGLAGTGVVAGTTLVEASVEGDAWGLNAATGQVLWQASLTSDPYAGNLTDLMYDGSQVYVGMSSVDEPLISVIANFVPTSRGSVIALDPTTGAQLWQTYITKPPATGGAVWSSFAVDPALGLVFCDTGNNYTGPATDATDAVLAMRTDTGKIVWKRQVTANDASPAFGPDDDFGAGPQLISVSSGGTTRQLVGALQKQGVYWVFDRATGVPAWHVRIGHHVQGSDGEASIGGGRVFVWADSRTSKRQQPKATVMALDPVRGRPLWTRPLAQASGTAAAGFLSDDVYFVGDRSGRIQAYRARDGKILWSGLTRRGMGVVSSLWVEGRFLYAGVGSGNTAGLQAFRVH
jgi:polyvinyl alcohol dehydrogenase (cytochrome)